MRSAACSAFSTTLDMSACCSAAIRSGGHSRSGWPSMRRSGLPAWSSSTRARPPATRHGANRPARAWPRWRRACAMRAPASSGAPACTPPIRAGSTPAPGRCWCATLTASSPRGLPARRRRSSPRSTPTSATRTSRSRCCWWSGTAMPTSRPKQRGSPNACPGGWSARSTSPKRGTRRISSSRASSNRPPSPSRARSATWKRRGARAPVHRA